MLILKTKRNHVWKLQPLMDEGYKMVTPFFIEDGGKAGTYSWEYVNAHLVVRTK